MQIPVWRSRERVDKVQHDAPMQSAQPGDKDLLPRLLASSLQLVSLATPPVNCLLLSDQACDSDAVFTGESQALLRKMLSAIEINLDDCSVAALANAQSASDSETLASLLASHPVATVLYLVNCEASAAPVIRESLQPITSSRQVATRLAVCFHPQMLLSQPALKRDAWEVLKRIRSSHL